MVWSCISANCFGSLVKIDGISNAAKYHQTLIHHSAPSGKRLIDKGIFFQHDDDPRQTATIVKSYLNRKHMIKRYQFLSGHLRGLILTSVKQFGITLTKNKTINSQHLKKSFAMYFKKHGEVSLKAT